MKKIKDLRIVELMILTIHSNKNTERRLGISSLSIDN